jgi:hypothetical protein
LPASIQPCRAAAGGVDGYRSARPGVPFISDADLDRALLEAGVPATTADAVVEVNANARIEALRVSLAVLAVLATIAIFMTRLLPTTPAVAIRALPRTDLTSRSQMSSHS